MVTHYSPEVNTEHPLLTETPSIAHEQLRIRLLSVVRDATG